MNQFVEFTRPGELPMAIHVRLIKFIEKAQTADCARVVLFEKYEGHDSYWTLEPYQVIRDRLMAAQESAR